MNRIQILILIFFAFVLSENSQAKGKDFYIWFDCEANFERLSHADSITYYLDKVKAIGVTDVVVDVKSIMGEVLYKSNIAPYMGEWQGHSRSIDFDMLGIFIEEGHKRGLGVHASLNIFSGGHNFHKRGIIYKQHPEWQSQNYWIDKIMPISEMEWNYNGMLNPALPEVQDYELSILKEFVAKYSELDGIVLDRGRYDGITSDFSQKSKELFEAYSGVRIENFPDDIIYWEKDDKGNDIWKRGKHFNLWVEWRASVIYNFFEKARREVKKINKNLSFGDYTGAWYPVYYEVGVNWASKKYDPSKEYNWATEKYKDYGYAELLDVYMSGLYFKEVTIAEVEKMNEEAMKNRTEAAMGKGRDYWYSVEGSAKLAKEVTKGAVPVTGSIYVDQYEGDAKQFGRAVSKAIECTDGLMIFDAVHIINRNWWDVLEQAVIEGKNR